MQKKFLYGVSSAAFQIEGDDGKQGRGASVWDEYCKRENTIYQNQNATIATDHYHRYKEDVALMKELGVNAYRFSISWSRILPQGIGEINQEGIDFYCNLIDELNKYGIEPVLTLYHWDLPEALSCLGGFQNPDFPKWFRKYAETVNKYYGKKIRYVVTFNEPINAIHSSYRAGVFAPGYRLNEYQSLLCMRNMILAHNEACKVFSHCNICIAMSTFEEYPHVNTEKCFEITSKLFFEKESFTESIDTYLDPVYFGKYPERVFERYPQFYDICKNDDLSASVERTNLIGFNNYSGTPIDEEGNVVKRKVGAPLNGMGNPIDTNGLYWGCKILYNRYKKPVLITENGTACEDFVFIDGKVHDSTRIDYLHHALMQVEKLQKEEFDIVGYCVWSFTDNFEWLTGYSKRFGLVYIDYDTLKRIPKDSYYFYKKYIENK